MVNWTTETRKPAPQQRKFYALIFAAIIILFFMLLPLEIGAQSQPEPTPECVTVDGELLCISAIALTPFAPTSTPVLAPTVAPTVTPTPTIEIRPFVRHVVYLALIYR